VGSEEPVIGASPRPASIASAVKSSRMRRRGRGFGVASQYSPTKHSCASRRRVSEVFDSQDGIDRFPDHVREAQSILDWKCFYCKGRQ
jgi:hypothetical protein